MNGKLFAVREPVKVLLTVREHAKLIQLCRRYERARARVSARLLRDKIADPAQLSWRKVNLAKLRSCVRRFRCGFHRGNAFQLGPGPVYARLAAYVKTLGLPDSALDSQFVRHAQNGLGCCIATGGNPF
jgi:hypothetical protein